MTDLYPPDYGNVARGGHCGVLAVAILAGRTFHEAWEALTPPGARKGRRKWAGGTNEQGRRRVLQLWGVPFRQTRHVYAGEYRRLKGEPMFAIDHASLPRCSVQTFARKYAKPGVTYMLRIRGHVLTLRDGITIDQTEACPVEQYSLRNSIVTISTERTA